MREIEIKIKVKDLKYLEGEFRERGCLFSEPINQHDTIYSLNNSSEEFDKAKEGDIVIRIRRQNNKVELNLKQQRSSEPDNIEYETEIGNPETTHRILLLLGWYPKVEVKKIRKRGKLGDYEICLDQVEELGDYMEIEKMTEDTADPNKIREELFEVLESVGLSREDEEIRGYDTQIFQLQYSETGN